MESLTEGAALPGVLSEVERGEDGLPVRVWLRERTGGERLSDRHARRRGNASARGGL